MNQIILVIAASQMTATGKLLETLKPDPKSKEFLIGEALDLGGQALGAIAGGTVGAGVDGKLKLVADAIYEHLGLSPLQLSAPGAGAAPQAGTTQQQTDSGAQQQPGVLISD